VFEKTTKVDWKKIWL